EKYKREGEAIFHWLPADEKQLIKAELLMPDKTLLKGLGEKRLSEVNVGSVIQLERIGFSRLDSKQKNKIVFWFAHR
ncbi:glutamate--tRNA ligase, partial [Candidatus Woesearchaeota archaeon]